MELCQMTFGYISGLTVQRDSTGIKSHKVPCGQTVPVSWVRLSTNQFWVGAFRLMCSAKHTTGLFPSPLLPPSLPWAPGGWGWHPGLVDSGLYVTVEDNTPVPSPPPASHPLSLSLNFILSLCLTHTRALHTHTCARTW